MTSGYFKSQINFFAALNFLRDICRDILTLGLILRYSPLVKSFGLC